MVEHPLLVVVSGSMCTVGPCDGWSHPFEETLHSGDLILIKGITSDEIKAEPYPEGDILVFYRPKPSPTSPDELIVHRVINRETGNGLEYFRTKGDGNKVHDHWSADYRDEYSWNGMISSELIVGKVIMRIPWIGHLAWFMRSPIGIYLIISLIIILVAIGIWTIGDDCPTFGWVFIFGLLSQLKQAVM